ncbi:MULTISPECIES: Cys-tRNA(Pro) deacylase [Spirulina sp. CCY15215]|uniref:Cys-tRNA(Pro) deacylase n=1 Tax=Spirulina sp. CCY15215 TaxID=2767591 RepID=UPI001950ED2D|nr:Cys-tRNA(Pro) deacylase [Spirulina major]
MKKTNAVRLLDNLRISYNLLEYEVNPEELAAEGTAEKVGLPPEQVFKTLLVRGDRTGICFAVIPGNASLNLRALAKLSGDRKMEMVALKEVQPLTGYIRGGVTALASKKAYPVYVEEIVEIFDRIAVSAGMRGCLILLSPGDYLQAVKGICGEISEF